MTDWISVEDRLPGKGENTLVWTSYLGGEAYVGMGYCCRGIWRDWADDSIFKPTHWQQLPDPPEVTND